VTLGRRDVADLPQPGAKVPLAYAARDALVLPAPAAR
jgi:hypothetical protein